MDKSKLHWVVNADRATKPAQPTVPEPAKLTAAQSAVGKHWEGQVFRISWKTSGRLA
jgi:hypothetical protein